MAVLTNNYMFNQTLHIMEKKAIIKGKISRHVTYDNVAEFSVDIRETNMFGHLFTIGEIAACEVHAEENDDFIIIQGHTMGTSDPGKLFKTAARFADGDAVEVEFKSTEKGWELVAITHNPNRGRPVGEYLDAMAEALEEGKKKYPQSYA